jgi:hypothetical protein
MTTALTSRGACRGHRSNRSEAHVAIEVPLNRRVTIRTPLCKRSSISREIQPLHGHRRLAHVARKSLELPRCSASTPIPACSYGGAVLEPIPNRAPKKLPGSHCGRAAAFAMSRQTRALTFVSFARVGQSIGKSVSSLRW